jgi:hypothetical protein
MSMASARLPDRIVRVSVLAALAMHDIVTTHPAGPKVETSTR